MEFREHALEYARLGFSVIPVRGKKPTIRSWKPYQTTPMGPGEIARRFSSPKVTGLAVILGSVSGDLCCRDFDRVEAYRAWARKFPGYAATLPTVQTARGFHVYFRAKAVRTHKFEDGELRGEGGYCLLPPSRHPDGPIYSWIREPSGEIPIVDPNLAGLSQTWARCTEGTEGIEGQRVQRYRWHKCGGEWGE